MGREAMWRQIHAGVNGAVISTGLAHKLGVIWHSWLSHGRTPERVGKLACAKSEGRDCSRPLSCSAPTFYVSVAAAPVRCA